MKKILIVIFILFLALASAGIYFLATLNVDQYRPQVENQVSTLLGKPVRLEKISIGWRSGLALSLRGLSVGNDPEFRSQWLRLESGSAELNVMPLLSREIQISSIHLNHPVIYLVKKPDGQFEGFERKTASAEPGIKIRKSAPKTAAALSFFVSDILIESGEVVIRDESTKNPSQIALRDLDIKIKNASLDQPIDVDAKGSIFSREQNIHLKGSVQFLSAAKGFSLRNVRAEADLSQVDISQVFKALPSLTVPSSLPEISGQLGLDVDSFSPGARGLKEFSAQARLRKGSFKTVEMKDAVQNISFDLTGSSDAVKLQNFSADFSGGKIQGVAAVNLKTPKPLTTVDFSIKNLLLENVLERPADVSAPELKGVLAASFQGTMSGNNDRSLTQTLAGEGRIDLDRGIVMNLNVLREVFQKLSIIPGLVDSLRKRMPADYQERLNARDTVLEPVRLPFTAKDGSLIFNQINVRTDSFEIQGGGSYGINSGRVGAQANLFIEPQLSQALIRSVNELEYLSDRSSGALKIPLNIQGRAPDIAVTPDLQYIASRLAVSKTQDVLSGLLKKTQPSEPQSPDTSAAQPLSPQTADSQAAQPSKPKLPKGKDILGALLQSALQTEDPQSSNR